MTGAGVLRRFPVTTGTVLTLVAAAALTGSVGAGPDAALRREVGAAVGGSPLSWAVSAFWCAGTASLLGAVVATVLLLGTAERRLGGRQALVAAVAGQVLGTAVGLSVVAVLAATGDTWAREISRMVVLGPFVGLLAAAGAATARMPALWRRRLRLMLTITLIALVLYSGTAGDVVRLSGWLLGLTAGLALQPLQETTAPHPSRREGRALVALVLAVTALGPLVAALSRTPDGPWAVVSHLFVSSRPDHALLRAVCGRGGDPADCRVLEAHARLTGHGPALLSILPVVLQLVLAEGLRRGRRAAWGGAVLLTGALSAAGALVVVTVVATPAEMLPMLGVRPGSLPTVSIVAPLVAPLAVLALLVATRPLFDVRAAPGSLQRWVVAAGAGTAGIVAAYLVVGSLLRNQFRGAPSAFALLLDLPSRMLPPGYLGEVVPRLVPLHGRAAHLLADWTGVALWTLLLATAVCVVRPGAPDGDAGRARALVDLHGEGPLSFMTTWVGNRYWFTADGSAVVAFRVLGGVALTTGDPVGLPAARRAAVQGFTAWCEEHGWTPCWYAVPADVADALAGAGARRLQVAAETWLPLAGLSFTGRRWQDVRTALNRADREGVRAVWTTWSRAPLPLREQLARLSEEWLADKGLPEMGFTLGGLDELADDSVRCLLAVDRDGHVVGLTSWLPAHRDGWPVGWTLDVMRRARTAPPGTVEFLIATALQTFREEGAEFTSLSGTPLALPPGTEDRGGLTRLLEAAGRLMEPVYGFRSLLAFKAKFQPRYRPLWLVYPGTADLPRIAQAVSRAYLPDLSLPQAARLTGALVRGRRRPSSRPAQTAVRV